MPAMLVSVLKSISFESAYSLTVEKDEIKLFRG
jgi:hypothetical protein